ncbi:RNA polymerase II elongation factor ELL-like [Acanthochromis polyacanthus]|uniref:RNA polymerase II elongation factor ELL-like n=1 Tax=Acanthochromis polyacanthus TaxID=80966 RepID=UPI002234AFC4|nr:RNA polymerase II elongation factor ELL-like [Acanthochromis polyacanthus]
MASLRQEHQYGLCCGKNNKNSPNRTLYHVKLTDTAIRALEAFQNLKGSLPSEPSICFKGNQGYIKIPAPTSESPSALRVFSFYLSSDSKDQPQASFECIHQYVSGDGRDQLEGQGSIQDKITVCATDDSYQMTRERMSQVEKDSWSRSAIEIKPGATHPSKCIKYQKRPAAPLSASDSSFCKQPTNNRRNGTLATPTQKPLRDRIIHLLALKPYRKPELLLWLERERASPKDKAELSATLEEVAKVNPKDSSYLLRDDLYRYIQRDWPGYSEEERQLISRLLARKLQPHISNQSRNVQANPSLLKTSEDQSIAKTPAVKRPVPFESMERLSAKRQKLTDQRLQQQPAVNELLNNKAGHNNANLTLNPSFHTKTEFQRTSNHPDNQNGLPGNHNDFPIMHKLSSTSDGPVTEIRVQEPKGSSLQPPQCGSDCASQQPTNSQHKKKKSKKHKDKERERLKDNQGTDWIKTSPDLKQNPDKLDNPDIANAVASEEKPDYVLTYGTIKSSEQRQRYQEDFCAEYDEYKDLHSRIATITHMFVQLGSKIKSLSPGTQEYKIMEDQILEKYNKYRKKFPGYREEKKRCEYLHEKLSYIKQLIIDYDVCKASS